jgi:hypothetical protein
MFFRFIVVASFCAVYSKVKQALNFMLKINLNIVLSKCFGIILLQRHNVNLSNKIS